MIFERLAAVRPAYLHVGSEGAHWDTTSFLSPDMSITGLAREVTSAPVIANGGMLGWALRARGANGAARPLLSTCAAAVAISVLLIGVWALSQGGVPEFSDTGII